MSCFVILPFNCTNIGLQYWIYYLFLSCLIQVLIYIWAAVKFIDLFLVSLFVIQVLIYIWTTVKFINLFFVEFFKKHIN